MTTQFDLKTKAVLTIGALLLIFLVPMIVAWSLYSSKAPTLQTVNYGELITPPLELNHLVLHDTDQTNFPMVVLQGKWAFIYISPIACQKPCIDNLYKMRQVRLALGKDQERIQRILITVPGPVSENLDRLLAQDYLGTLHAVATSQQLHTFLTNDFATKIKQQQGGLFIADPLGNVMLYYAPGVEAEHILKDLTRLLRTSQIG